MGYSANTELIFYILSIFKDLKFTLGIMIPTGIGYAGEMYAAIMRINKILIADELPPNSENDGPNLKPLIELKEATVHMNGNTILKNIYFRSDSGLTLVTGTVGSGKSSLLKTILKDYPLTKGYVRTHGHISYTSQDPWLFPSTIKQNILFGEKFNEKRYQDVVRVCALQYDFNLFEKRDETIVCDRGLNLSKGQQSRINLARSIYKESDIYLLDDSLATLDARVQTARHIHEVDNVVIMDKGQIKSVGKPDKKIILEINELICKDGDLEKEINKEYYEEEIREKQEESKLLEAEQTISNKVYAEVKKIGEVDYAIYKKVDEQQKVLDLEANFTKYLHIENKYSTKLLVEAKEKENFTIKLYAIVIVISTTLGLIKTYGLLDFCRKASIKMHNIISYTIINAVISFFDSHFIGNILNRFSQDLNNIDETLPFVIFDCFEVTFSVTGIIILMATVNWQFLIAFAVFIIILIILRKFYLPASRSLKRLEAISLTTIRAYKAQRILTEAFDRHQDLFTSANYSLECASRAFGCIIDVLCSILIALVIAKFIFIDTGTSAGNVGLVLTQVLMLAGHIQFGIRQWAEIENLMTSVERVLEYTDIKQETTGSVSLKNWPGQGVITYENVTLAYDNNKQVLKNLNFTVESKQKIGIVGRTGTGKSSIIVALFRLYEVEGKILIDGVDIKTLPLKFLRKKIAIIPQDPILFTGTIRSNLDPFGEFTEVKLWAVLRKLNLHHLITSLEFEVEDGGSNFSLGQKQLLCLARAIIRKTKIVILDESTANMDHETDTLLHDTIKENFSDCTLITIAHRLHSVLKCDKVLVLDRGEIKEYEDPI
ncbi:hypothetical protein NQ314_003891, partial [Rhamnusium bicolor]